MGEKIEETERAIPAVVAAFCLENGFGEITDVSPLAGGLISTVRRITARKGTLVLKEDLNAPPDMFARERQGLEALRGASPLAVPMVYLYDSSFILLEDLGTGEPGRRYWADFGSALAQQHGHTNARFGFTNDNYLGRLPQRNRWMERGHHFFIHQRVLRYLEEPLCRELLTTDDLGAIGRFCDRLRELIPNQPASLLHGDLWTANMMVGPRGEPAVIDPAVYYGWPEAELSMVRQYPGVPESFFDAYREAHPLERGWEERLEILSIRELVAMIAHIGDTYGSVAKLRELVAKYG